MDKCSSDALHTPSPPLPHPTLGSLSSLLASRSQLAPYDGQSTYASVLLPEAEMHRQQQSQSECRREEATKGISVANCAANQHLIPYLMGFNNIQFA